MTNSVPVAVTGELLPANQPRTIAATAAGAAAPGGGAGEVEQLLRGG